MAEYKVLLTASGLGSRLGNITDYTNKSLVRVGAKPAISYIVESYDKSIPFVVTLGHYGEHVKDFLELAYPDRIFQFVKISNYAGKGSSLGLSMLKAKELLQCPFIFHACDTITLDDIPAPTVNWMAGKYIPQSSQYRTLQVSGEKVVRVNEKGEIRYDLVYAGLAGIYSYKSFWSALENIYDSSPLDSSLSDCHALSALTEDIDAVKLSTWYDIGNTTSLKEVRRELGSNFKILDKVDENIFIFDNFVIKFFHNKKINLSRVKRVNYLNKTTPNILSYRDNFYKYELAKGELLSHTLTPARTKDFLEYVQSKLWSTTSRDSEFPSVCYDFYIKKSLQRIEKYVKDFGRKEDITTTINSEEIPSAETLIQKLAKKDIYSNIKTHYHGDFILDNIIDTPEGYSLIDWRQDFGGELEFGDVYYDLAKLNHNLIFNHDIVNRELYTVEDTPQGVNVDILVSKRLLECREVFRIFVEDNGYDYNKIQMLTGMIWINMAPLHEYPLNKFLFNFGKYNLKRALNDE